MTYCRDDEDLTDLNYDDMARELTINKHQARAAQKTLVGHSEPNRGAEEVKDEVQRILQNFMGETNPAPKSKKQTTQLEKPRT